MPNQVLRSCFWTLHFFSLLVAALWLSWWLLTPLDFGYRAGYQWLDIDTHISTFGPQNAYKHGYETTSQAERFTHFTAIVDAINSGGDGLAEISYRGTLSQAQTLLRDAEVVHLQDVANLVADFHLAGAITLLLWLATAGYAGLKQWSFPPFRQLILGGAIVLALPTLIITIIGPTAVFYWLHTRIFPEDHQWFFYYQESLMTTLMKAPDLFGFIALLWVALSVLLIVAIVKLQKSVLQKLR